MATLDVKRRILHATWREFIDLHQVGFACCDFGLNGEIHQNTNRWLEHLSSITGISVADLIRIGGGRPVEVIAHTKIPPPTHCIRCEEKLQGSRSHYCPGCKP